MTASSELFHQSPEPTGRQERPSGAFFGWAGGGWGLGPGALGGKKSKQKEERAIFLSSVAHRKEKLGFPGKVSETEWGTEFQWLEQALGQTEVPGA